MRQTSEGHSDHVPHPMQWVLGDYGLNTWTVCSLKDLSVSHSVTPSEAQGTLEATDVEVFNELHLMTVSNPGFSAVQEGGDAHSLLDRDFCAFLCS